MAGTFAQKSILNLIYASGAHLLSRYWLSGLGVIVTLHHVRPGRVGGFDPNDHLSVSPKFLEAAIIRLRRRGYRFVHLDTIVEKLANTRERAEDDDPLIALTLDDAYRDNLEHAVPIFRRHETPYTIYVAPGLVDGRADLWWEDLAACIAARSDIHLPSPRGTVSFDVSTQGRKRRAFHELLEFLSFKVSEQDQRKMVRALAQQCKVDPTAHRNAEIMDWKELRELNADPLCQLGAHTVHHYAIARLSQDEALREMQESARILEMETGKAPKHFAFPYGFPRAAGPRDFELAREAGFATAVTTRPGMLYREHAQHLHALPRISLNGRFQAGRYLDVLLSGLPTRLVNRGKRLHVA